jgi:hypothetical protein
MVHVPNVTLNSNRATNLLKCGNLFVARLKAIPQHIILAKKHDIAPTVPQNTICICENTQF